jgi:hypothetical protein
MVWMKYISKIFMPGKTWAVSGKKLAILKKIWTSSALKKNNRDVTLTILPLEHVVMPF